MRTRLLLCVLFTFAAGACSGSSTQPTAKPRSTSELQAIAAESLSAEADRPRQEMVRQELDRFAEHALGFSARNLSPQDHRLLAKLLEAAQLVDEINLLQIHPQMLEFRSKLISQGTPEDRRLFERNHGPWCLANDDVRCCAMRQQPPRSSGVWPADLTSDELAQIPANPESRALLSPFTVVRRESGKLRAVAPARDVLLGPKVRALSAVLEEAAQRAGEPTLKKFLRSRARALVSDDPFPFDDSDLDWIAVQGRWEVTVGPYEAARDPRGIKARYAMWIGIEDPMVSDQLANHRKSLQVMENSVAGLVGRKLYKARTVDPRTAIRAVELVMASGDARLSRGVVGSYTLPTMGKAVQQGLSKKVMLINQMRAFTPTIQARAKAVLDLTQIEHLQEQAILLNATFHEFCHSFGPYDDLEVQTADGKATVARALGTLAPLMDELKATVLSLWLPGEQRKPKLGETELHQRHVSALMQLLGLLTYEPEGAEIQAAAVVIGALLDAKALKFDETTRRWSLVHRTLPRALRDLAKRIITLQLTGDRAGAAKFIGTYVQQKGRTASLVENLDRLSVKVRDAFQQAGVKGLAITYRVTDLSVTVPAPRADAPLPRPVAQPKPAPVAKPIKGAIKAEAKPQPKGAGKPEPKGKKAEEPAKPEPKAKGAGKPEAKAKKAAEEPAKPEAKAKKAPKAKAKKTEEQPEGEQPAKPEAKAKKAPKAKAKKTEAPAEAE